MYRLVLYYLIGLVTAAVVLSIIKIIPYDPPAIVLSTVFLVVFCWIFNFTFSKLFRVSTNFESVYITALILALIVTPTNTLSGFIFLGMVSLLAMSSKYILAIHKKHIFNPAAIAVVITSLAIHQSASWWIGTEWMVPFVVIGGVLVVRKIKRFDMVAGFIMVAIALTVIFGVLSRANVWLFIDAILFHSSLFFFGFVMLTEPLTTPPTKNLQIIYGVLVGILFVPQVNVGGFYLTPELALVIGNIFSYLVSPKERLILKLKEKIKIGSDTFEFLFPLNQKYSFLPGQYMEWTLPHDRVDRRGNRRYFTIASSPTEEDLRLGVKFYDRSSSFKNALQSMDEKTKIIASQCAGDFVLPKDIHKKLVFIAGGIGITPFRSMLKYLIDTIDKRQILVLYCNKTTDEIVYEDILDEAENRLGIKTVYILTNPENIPDNWKGEVGRINEEMIRKYVADFAERTFYLSGPRSMVVAYEKVLKAMGVRNNRIKVDFFPGFV